MKKRKQIKIGRRTLLFLAVFGSAVGIAIIFIVALNYSSFYGNGFYYGNVKIGGNVLSHEIDNDIYLIIVSSLLVISSLSLLFRVLRNKKIY